MKPSLAVVLLSLQLATLFGCRPARDELTSTVEHPTEQLQTAVTKAGPYSNIYRQDYVGPKKCGSCHEPQFDMWKQHPHAKMNQLATSNTVLGSFDGASIDYVNSRTTFTSQNGQYFMTVENDGQFMRKYRVTRTVGSRVFQMYIGMQIQGPEAPNDTIYTEERKLPFAYWIERDEWFPETYDEPSAPAEFDANGSLTKSYQVHSRNFRPVWEENCIWCHNTYPYQARVQKQMPGFSNAHVALSRVTAPIQMGSDVRRHAIAESDLVSIGISCESCHFGGREHAIEKRPIRFLPSGEHFSFAKSSGDAIARARETPYIVNGICAQCHSANQPKFPNYGSTWNSAEAIDMQRGNCASEIRCIDCHSPHQVESSSPRTTEDHLKACLDCHTQFQDTDTARNHSKHATTTANCLDCHMPKIVHGRDRLVRTHLISSPTDIRMLEQAAPNACNLCHVEKSIEWTIDHLKRDWGKQIEPSAAWSQAYAGNLKTPVGAAWLRHPAPVVRKTAVDAFAKSRFADTALPTLIQILNDPNPGNRMFGLFAIERILGRRIERQTYVPWLPPKQRASAVAEFERILKRNGTKRIRRNRR